METVHVSNIKCGGCEASITHALEKVGATDIVVDVPTQTISFTGDSTIVLETLSIMGYPEVGSEESASLIKKARSYMSCMIGKLRKE